MVGYVDSNTTTKINLVVAEIKTKYGTKVPAKLVAETLKNYGLNWHQLLPVHKITLCNELNLY